MKNILCYGDSNTYGFIPGSGARYSKNMRWSGILGNILLDCNVTEEGKNNRTGFFKSSAGIEYSGIYYLPKFLKDCPKIDICILSVGTNDAQKFYNLDENTIKAGIAKYTEIIKNANSDTKIFMMSPVKITSKILNSSFGIMFDQGSVDRLGKLLPVFQEAAKANDCVYIDLNNIAKPSEIDGLHYSAETHTIIAKYLAQIINSII